MDCFHLMQLGAKIVQPVCRAKGAKLIYEALEDLEPALILNHALNQATKYRTAVRLVQRRWLSKYNNRLAMLHNFAQRHVESMLKEYPHLRMGYSKFKEQNMLHKTCYSYMVDESVKFRQIYSAYVKRNQEIEEFIDANYEIQAYNKNKPESKWKKYLEIPKRPLKPQQRVFRNLDILKGMLRGWFELEYKKILRRNISGY